ncbi:MAG: sulfatase-like hydrolase/transferase [Lachnospiraceae bacterium]|nr:sulfatase-like hydrolase/transferase [Lachnospiraceae bacterium]
MNKRPNIILIMTDQQRFDTAKALGNDLYITPNLDRLANEGVVFENCFCSSPTCMPSRASLFNCKYPGRTGVFSNSDSWDTSWVSILADAGYHCVNVGKMHTYPYDVPCGFHQRYVVENKDRRCDRMGLDNQCGRFEDELDKYFAWAGMSKPDRKFFVENYPDFQDAVGCFKWPYEEKYHHDVFVGDMACRVIERKKTDEPLFLQIGFPGPHPPFDPPQRFIDMYDDVEFPGDIISAEEAEKQPKAQRMFRQRAHGRGMDGVIWPVDPTKEQIARMRKNYAANVTMIDEKIGEIMDTLEKKGYLDDAIIIFTSDHGECLGDHRLFEKWCMYDCVTRIPAIMWSSKDRVPHGKRTDVLAQQFDLIHTLFDMIGLSLPDDCQSISLGDLSGEIVGRDCVYAEHAKDHVMRGCEFMTMARTDRYKLVHYQNEESENELYDLQADPEERVNCYHDPAYSDVRNQMIMKMLNFKCMHHYGVPEIYKECLANEPPVKL